MYTAPKLVELLERKNSPLFKKGAFSLKYRAKVGSFPHPNLETLVSVGEPCGNWKIDSQRDFGKIGDRRTELPLNGYIPASAIRGIVRAWAEKRPDIRSRMHTLLGKQENDSITSGKFIFFDAYPSNPVKLKLDIVNPQQEFQVFHDSTKQSNPQPFYTFGDGKSEIEVVVAIQGIAGKATIDEVEEVWDWVSQALLLYGVGSRTASGYGRLKQEGKAYPKSDSGFTRGELDFSLYSQGCYGIQSGRDPELRPSHWRGWLRSWILRFLLGVMNRENAEKTLYELMGTIEPVSQQGCLRLEMIKGKLWGKKSENDPKFYLWQGKISLSAPTDILNQIIFPIITFAVSVGGVGRGWRRPLHMFVMETRDGKRKSARGSHLKLTHKKNEKLCPLILSPDHQVWQQQYTNWSQAVRSKWGDRFLENPPTINAEVFSPKTCAVYIVPFPKSEPIDFRECEWIPNDVLDSRGKGMDLIYDPKYKKNRDVGGDAGGGNAHCSWVSIKRVGIPNRKQDTDCQEIVCLFLGTENNLRSRFLGDLASIGGSRYFLFGKQPQC